jgi:hypothetical protein
MMQHSTTIPRFQFMNWTKATMHSKQYILCYVGTGWFSRAWRRARNWPFWSHSIFLYEQMERSVYMFSVACSFHSSILAQLCSAFSHLSDVA